MQALLFRILETLFPLQRHEWPKALMLLSVATLLGVASSVSRAASEALFLTRFGVEYLPYVQLVNPALVLVSTTIYGTFASRISNDRMMVYTALIPVPIILVMRLLIMFDMSWTYFLLFAFVLAYASVVITSWAVYLPGHYDVQEAKRLLPFINSGMLIGTVLGGLGVALFVPVLGAPNVLFVWIGTLLAVVVLAQSTAKLFTTLDAEASKVRRTVQKPKSKPGMLESLREGVTYSRSSALFMTTAIASIATVVALQLLDFEYSKIFARKYPDSAQLTAFLGVVDGLTTIFALGVQWFVVPRCIRNLGVKGTNLLFPYTLTAAFGGLLAAPIIGPAIFARFTRYSLMPSLRGTTRTLILNAVPRKTNALVRSFNTGIVMPAGQGAGALALMVLKGFDMPLIIPLAGLLAAACYVFYTHRQNAAYGDALLDLLKEDKIHLLDLEDDEIRQLDASAVQAISERLRPDRQPPRRDAPAFMTPSDQAGLELPSAQEEETLAAIELLRAIGNRPAFVALQQHLPYATPRLTTAALHALAAIDGKAAREILQPYLEDGHPQVRLAALAGLRRLGDDTLQSQADRLLEDADVRVRAAALAIMLSGPETPESERAYRTCEEMLSSDQKPTLLAALSILADVPASPLHGSLYRALDHTDVEIRREALRVLQQLAGAGRIHEADVTLLRSLEDTDAECRELALQVLAALGTQEALEHMLVLLDDAQPRVREALTRAVRGFGKRAIEPLLTRLQSPHTSLIAKESALQALARLDGVQPDQLMPFWEGALRDVYLYKLMLVCLEESEAPEAVAFLRVALQNEHDMILSLLIQLLAVWTTPEVARLIESGLGDTDRQKRASALEALESLSERRFTRLFLPILEAGGDYAHTWRDVARQQWNLVCSETSTVLETCLQSSDKWVIIGALLAGQAWAETLGESWRQRAQQLAATATDPDVRETAKRVLGEALAGPRRTFSLTDIMLFLKRMPLYSTMNLDQLYTIATNFTERQVQAGEVIFRQDDQSCELYLIASGEVEVVKRYGEDDQVTLASLPAGQFFGDMAIFENRPRSATIVATKPGVLLVLSPERFRDVIMQEPAISFEIFRELSARLRRIDVEPLEVADQSAG